MKICKNCGKEIDKKASVCVSCGVKVKKPIFKKWWFWLIIVIVIGIAASGSSQTPNTSDSTDVAENEETVPSTKEEIVYEVVDLGVMMNDLKSNALKAERTYQDKNVEIKGRIYSFDSDGSYISIEPEFADEWNFETALCYIKNDSQLDYLLEKAVGDIVTIKGKVKSVGEVLGFSINIDEVQ